MKRWFRRLVNRAVNEGNEASALAYLELKRDLLVTLREADKLDPTHANPKLQLLLMKYRGQVP